MSVYQSLTDVPHSILIYTGKGVETGTGWCSHGQTRLCLEALAPLVEILV